MFSDVFLINWIANIRMRLKSLSGNVFFPAKSLTLLSETRDHRRYHIHEVVVSKAIKKAVNDARITKCATAHTFRHYFANHLLQANYGIRTLQDILGLSDVRATMIYLHTVQSRTHNQT